MIVPQSRTADSELASQAQESINLATQYAWNIAKEDGHWNGELRANATITAENIFFHQSLGRGIPDADAYRQYLLSQQQEDGSWSIAPLYPGDVSTSCEAYLALKILGVSPEAPQMQKAKNFIQSVGGVAKVRIFTRMFFAQFGLFPWKSIPQMPVEFIMMPAKSPVSIYRLASWARSTIVPLLIIRHHEKIYALPNGARKDNDFLDELWVDPSSKAVPYSPPVLKTMRNDPISLAFTVLDQALYVIRGFNKRQPFRRHALKRCVKWILEHQEREGDWAGIVPPMHAGVQALLLEGYTLEDDVIRRGIEAVERFTWEDGQGKRLQSCVSPVWDTVLMTRSLCDAGVETGDNRLWRAVRWIESKQLLGPEGDWRLYNRKISPGGFSFEYNNSWYPDTDDTAAAILALINQNPESINGVTVTRAVLWLCGMQNKDGGWGAFDINNDKLWLNRSPFSDMDALCDPSSADVTGRILEAFGLILKISKKVYIDDRISKRISGVCETALGYLIRNQEPTGAWYGRWGSNYLYGTSNVLCGLQYFSDRKKVVCMMSSAVNWLRKVQNSDGGWGEALESYRDVSRAGRGPSTPSQTAWALMGILTVCGSEDEAVTAAVSYFVRTQTDKQGQGASWPETRYTGTGFPNYFYIGYTLYRHYFPMMALGRYLQVVDKERVYLP